jgi:hypothetical protein
MINLKSNTYIISLRMGVKVVLEKLKKILD